MWGSVHRFRPIFSVAISLVLFGACDTPVIPPALQAPSGDSGGLLEGVWTGTQNVLGDDRRVIIYLQQEGELLAGHVERSRTRLRAREPQCQLLAQPINDEGRYDWFGASISYDKETDTLWANVAADNIFDAQGVFSLKREAWLGHGDVQSDSLFPDRTLGNSPIECFDRPNLVTQCANGIDDDEDGDTDRRDNECNGDLSGNLEQIIPECEDGLDNDHDGLTDAEDPDCLRDDEQATEHPCSDDDNCEVPDNSCDNGIDDNNNGLIDSEDPACVLLDEETRHHCMDGIDNDGDGVLDLDEPGCELIGNSDERSQGLLAPIAPGEFGVCLDGIDNDDDGNVDTEDRQCRFAFRGVGESEVRVPARFDVLGDCNNGLDDDGDGLMDDEDPSCATPVFVSQTMLRIPQVRSFRGDQARYQVIETRYEGLPPCINGLDDDGDGLIDMLDDGCRFAADPGETLPCEDGLDNNNNGLVDAEDPACLDRYAQEIAWPCNDGVDNDGDGLVDLEDTGCVGPLDFSEFGVCEDGLDNDVDGLIDAADPDCTAGDARESTPFPVDAEEA